MSITPSTPDPLQFLVGEAAADLARRLEVEIGTIQTISAEAVVWPDRSLGCPVPGMNYLQVQVDGARIVLACDDRTYVYHSGGGQPPFLCAYRLGKRRKHLR